MNAADIISAVRQAGAALRIEGDSLVASNASRIAPDLKAAIRENKPHLIAALVGSGLAGRRRTCSDCTPRQPIRTRVIGG
jgi:hypothetical protein